MSVLRRSLVSIRGSSKPNHSGAHNDPLAISISPSGSRGLWRAASTQRGPVTPAAGLPHSPAFCRGHLSVSSATSHTNVPFRPTQAPFATTPSTPFRQIMVIAKLPATTLPWGSSLDLPLTAPHRAGPGQSRAMSSAPPRQPDDSAATSKGGLCQVEVDAATKQTLANAAGHPEKPGLDRAPQMPHAGSAGPETVRTKPSASEHPQFSMGWWKDWAIIFVIFGITGSTAVSIVRPFLNNVIGIEGTFAQGPWLFRICYLMTTLPFYSLVLVTVGTLFGRGAYFRYVARRMWGRFIPSSWRP
ncbi:uncharacterized protein BJ171DRAFT_501433 [Polychytrium aggregatum]|uniref:uncharacterized protein n=1 Tax=Polychytrium aggregatum TaxID=110093 RepID=UPI0022FF3A2C|nr:uncharacterized protein BJ171DRAFT_501433 [Polychytrium aggregatum]KAI9205222.1 hypothetical protein BJ171DRAFT_501433 [Polychytrium aggregatum]